MHTLLLLVLFLPLLLLFMIHSGEIDYKSSNLQSSPARNYFPRTERIKSIDLSNGQFACLRPRQTTCVTNWNHRLFMFSFPQLIKNTSISGQQIVAINVNDDRDHKQFVPCPPPTSSTECPSYLFLDHNYRILHHHPPHPPRLSAERGRTST